MPPDQLNDNPSHLTQEVPAIDFWKSVAVSARGSSHEKNQLPCQDAFRLAMVSEEILIIAVADGAGSAAFAEIGSELAVRISVEKLCIHLTEFAEKLEETDLKTLLAETIKYVRTAIEAEAIRRLVPARELATTLILVIATPDLVAAAQIGDGATIIEDSEGNLIGLTVPKPGEYINEVTFVISPEALETAQIVIWKGLLAHVAVFSDGLQMLCLAFPDFIPHKGFFTPLFHFILAKDDEIEAEQELSAFLDSQRVRQLTDDDMTLVLATVKSKY